MRLSRRLTLCAAATAVAALSLPAWAQDKLKVAAIYTVPVEQQWVVAHRQGAEGGGRRAARSSTCSPRTSPTPTTSA